MNENKFNVGDTVRIITVEECLSKGIDAHSGSALDRYSNSICEIDRTTNNNGYYLRAIELHNKFKDVPDDGLDYYCWGGELLEPIELIKVKSIDENEIEMLLM